MKKVINNQNIEDTINELTATYLEKVCEAFGHERNIEDVDWQIVYDLKVRIFGEFLPALGYEVVYEED